MSHNTCLLLLFSAIFISHSSSQPASFCRTPGRKMGRCVSIYECEYLLDILKSNTLSQQSIKFLQLSQCDAGTFDNGEGAPYVCCARNDDNLTLSSDTTVVSHMPALSANSTMIRKSNERELNDSIVSVKRLNGLLPDRSVCGQEVVENRIYSGQDTSRGEFPWTALLEYRKFSGEISINCGGSLISKQYVLTAAHCLKGDIVSRIGQLENVRLGDYDLQLNDTCSYNKRPCGNPYRFNEIDEIIPHEGFNNRAINRRHDIGIIRLRNSVIFNDVIKPVCLPIFNVFPMNAGDIVYITGFGRTLTTRTSHLKLKLRIPIYDQRECMEKFASKKVEIHDDQLCAGGEFMKDACDGDSGNGLIRFQNNWIIEGIVSFGYLCGLEGWPAIYTRTDQYIDWIAKNMK